MELLLNPPAKNLKARTVFKSLPYKNLKPSNNAFKGPFENLLIRFLILMRVWLNFQLGDLEKLGGVIN